MSHPSVGYFYYRYSYACPYTDKDKKTHVDNTYHSAVYTAHAASHTLQTQWLTTRALPAAQADITKNFYGDANRNKLGNSYLPFNQKFIKQEEFTWTQKPDTHTDGPLKGQIFRFEI